MIFILTKKPSTYKKYENILKNLNIYPYMFLPSKWEIDKLENPIKLVENKINVNNLNVLYLKEREETLHDKI